MGEGGSIRSVEEVEDIILKNWRRRGRGGGREGRWEKEVQ